MATTYAPSQAGPVRIGWPAMLVRSLRAEWTKLRSLRSTYGSVLATIGVTVGIAALFAWASSAGEAAEAARVTAIDLASIGITFGQFGILALAALSITGEHATSSIRSTLAATPARWAVVAAKAITVGVVSFASGFVATALAMLAAALILDKSTDTLIAASARSGAAPALIALVVLGLGAVLRSTAGTIFIAVAILFAPAILSGLVTNEIVTTVLDYLPADLAGAVAAGTGEPYGPLGAAALLGAWALAMLAAATFALHRRDS